MLEFKYKIAIGDMFLRYLRFVYNYCNSNSFPFKVLFVVSIVIKYQRNFKHTENSILILEGISPLLSRIINKDYR